MLNERRLKRAAVLSGERTSIGFQPKGRKNSGPSSGPNFSEEPPSLSEGSMFFWSKRRRPGDARSTIQC